MMFLVFGVVSVLLVGHGASVGKFSEVNSSTVYITPANVTDIQKFLDSQNINVQTGVPQLSSTPKFGVNTNVVLHDSNGTAYKYNSFFNVPQQYSLVSDNGLILDLGDVDVGVYGVSNSANNMLVQGRIQFWLDSNLEADRFFFGQGQATNKTLALTIDGKPDYKFTFKDEGANWEDGSSHYFKVMITQVNATVGTGFDTLSYASHTNFLAYELQMKLDKSKVVVKNLQGFAQTQYPADITIQTCGQTGIIGSQFTGGDSFNEYVIANSVSSPEIQILNNGYQIADLPPTVPSNPIPNSETPQKFGVVCGTKITGLPRDTILMFKVNGVGYLVQTPKTQYDYKMTCSLKDLTPNAGGNHQYAFGGCANNFGVPP